MAPATPLTALMLLLLQRAPRAGAQEFRGFELQQPQDKESVTAGQTLTLTCTVSGNGPPGPVRWLKGSGGGNETIYDQTGSYPRVTRAMSGSNTDFTIHIRDVQPEDAGTYYCVKFRKSLFSDVVFQSGTGTEVSVRAKPTHPVVSGPDHRVRPGQSVSFTCTAGGFFPEDIRVKWLRNEALILVQQPHITPGSTKSSYDMSSTVVVALQKDDVCSRLVCEVQHPTLKAPLREVYELSKALRVPPSIHVVVDPPRPVEVNETVSFTCAVKGFYPGDVAVTWLENGMEMKVENNSQSMEPCGLFELRNLVEVQATAEKNGSVFTCRVVHDGQEPVSEMATLGIAAPAGDGLWDPSQMENGVNLLYSPALWLAILLEKGLLGGLLFFLFKRGRA
ncbi:signal-regulatory protein beta-1-like [Nyctibius grandis]|uniref:signal-regulatory protein beta-1-like n=1 Tax=Nyctibius grandis TaxID=48427 RepID=UPI0035BBF4A9